MASACVLVNPFNPPHEQNVSLTHLILGVVVMALQIINVSVQIITYLVYWVIIDLLSHFPTASYCHLPLPPWNQIVSYILCDVECMPQSSLIHFQSMDLQSLAWFSSGTFG